MEVGGVYPVVKDVYDPARRHGRTDFVVQGSTKRRHNLGYGYFGLYREGM
jgi:hypothetical protein